jgi:hypothetical protein
MKCPNCKGILKKVAQTKLWLNDDQFDAVKAGDYYCEVCPEEKGTADKARTKYAYFWEKDINLG